MLTLVLTLVLILVLTLVLAQGLPVKFILQLHQQWLQRHGGLPLPPPPFSSPAPAVLLVSSQWLGGWWVGRLVEKGAGIQGCQIDREKSR